MISISAMMPPTGILLPESVQQAELFGVLVTFVAINTVMYATLAVAKLLPKIYPADWFYRHYYRHEHWKQPYERALMNQSARHRNDI